MPTLCERTPDLSVIIPVYNLEDYLAPMLKSLQEQDIGEYTVEIIFVLNNCTDRSEDVIRASGLECTILNCTTQGCGPARNMGMDHATGEYIWFMDGDDWLLSTTAIREALDKAKAEHLDILRVQYSSDRFNYLYFSMVWQYVLRREFIDEFRFPHIQPAEDDAFMGAVLGKAGYNGSNFVFLPHTNNAKYFYNYLREGSNMYRVSVLGEKI